MVLELLVLPLVSEVLLPSELGGVVMDSDGVLMAADSSSDADDTTKGGVPCTAGNVSDTGGRVQEDEAQNNGEIRFLSPAAV